MRIIVGQKPTEAEVDAEWELVSNFEPIFLAQI